MKPNADTTTHSSPDGWSHASAAAPDAEAPDAYTSATANRLNELLADDARVKTALPGSSLAGWLDAQKD